MRALLLGALGGVSAYELAALARELRGEPVSELVRAAVLERPIIPLTVGVVCGLWIGRRGGGEPRAAAALVR